MELSSRFVNTNDILFQKKFAGTLRTRENGLNLSRKRGDFMFLCNFTEYGSDNGVSMRDCFQDEPYSGKEKIVSYLKNNGEATVATAGVS